MNATEGDGVKKDGRRCAGGSIAGGLTLGEEKPTPEIDEGDGPAWLGGEGKRKRA